ncbi:MAG: hypothetical protein JWQ29_1299, partial [Phenylobacterium sp.]|nr:hypothetical protein [Phenylobacterium sp.]
MSGTGWQPRLRASPELFPLALDPVTDRVQLVQLAPVDYEKASFLDARLTAPVVLSPTLADLAAAAQGLAPACDYIFHVGHVGSTLLSRVLGTHPAVFSVREPQVLRTFVELDIAAGGAPDARLEVFLALYSRTWRPPQRALVKPTSIVGELAGRMLARDGGARAILMTAPAATYLATILGGPNSRVELRAAAPMRLARLHRRLGEAAWSLETLSEGEVAAMSWACEMTALSEAAERYPARTAWLDFDGFLADPRAGLSQALVALHGAADPKAVEAMARSAYFQRYSKAPSYAYGPEVRAGV